MTEAVTNYQDLLTFPLTLRDIPQGQILTMLLGHQLLAALDEYAAHNGLAGDGNADPDRRRVLALSHLLVEYCSDYRLIPVAV